MSEEIIKKSEDVLSNIYSYDIIVYLFWIIIFLSFIKLVFSKEPDEYFKKIIWWLSILVFALVSKNNFIIWISIFIWWLLIATEKFLIHLAWIFSSKKWDDLTTIYDSFSWVKHEIKEEKVTEEEKIKAIEEENKEDKINKKEECDIIKRDTKNINWNKPNNLVNYKTMIESENIVFEKFKEKFKNILLKLNIEKDIKIQNEYGNFILDWIIKNENKIIAWVEIKIFRASMSHISMQLRRYIERIRYMKLDFPFILIIASEKFDLSELNRIKMQFSNFDDINLLFFEYWNDINNWKFINEFNLGNILDSDKKSWIWRIIDVDWDMITVKFEDWRIKTLNKNFLTK